MTKIKIITFLKETALHKNGNPDLIQLLRGKKKNLNCFYGCLSAEVSISGDSSLKLTYNSGMNICVVKYSFFCTE